MAVLALVIAVVCVIMFQGFITDVTSDMAAAAELDRHMQLQAERVAVEHIVKEGLLRYYEEARLAAPPAGANTLINGMLDNMEGGGITYSVTSGANLPSNSAGVGAGSFWPVLASAGTTNLSGVFQLQPENNANGLSLRSVDSFLPPPLPAQQVIDSSKAANEQPIFPFVITRQVGAQTGSVIFTVDARMWQVPITDLNLVSYAIANSAASIPDAPAALSDALTADIASGTINALCLSKMSTGNVISSTTTYPYYYRDIFSAGSLVWEWEWFFGAYMNDYLRFNEDVDDEKIFWDLTPNDHNANDNDSATVNLPRFPTTESGMTYHEPSGSGGTAYWTIDLHNVRDGVSGASPESQLTAMNTETFRRICVYVPNSEHRDDNNRTIAVRVTDSSPGSVLSGSANPWETAERPVILWFFGREAPGQQLTVILEGDLTDQPVFIIAAGVSVVCHSAHLNGVLLLEPKNTLFATGGHTGDPALTVDGLLAYDGGVAGVVGDIGFADGAVVVNPYDTTDGANPFRPIAPRYLLVDTKSVMTINNP